MSSNIAQTSTINRDSKVLVNRTVNTARGTKTVKTSVPQNQVVQHNHLPAYYTNSFRSVPLNLFRNNGARYSGNIEQKAFTRIKNATLKMTITLQGALAQATLAPLPYWFDRIELRSNNGSNHLGIMRNDQLAFNLNIVSNDKLRAVLENANMQPDWSPKVEYNAAGAQYTFYLPLIGSYLDINTYFANIAGDIVLDFTPAASIVASGSATVDVDAMDLIIETENLTPEDAAYHQTYHSQVISSNRVLDFVPVTEYNKVLTANTVSTVDLDSVVGKCAGFLLAVKEAGATNTLNAQSTFVDLGDSATLDVVTNGGKSILGSGIPLSGKFLKNEVWSVHSDTEYAQKKNAYFIPFTQDLKSALKGTVDGYLTLNSSGHKLQIKPAVAGISAVQYIVAETTPTAGTFCFEFRGYKTPLFTVASTVTAMKTALDALPSMKRDNLTVTVSAVLGAGISITITFNAGRDITDKVTLLSNLIDVSLDPVIYMTQNLYSENSTDTVRGKSGFTSGTYDVHVYAMVYRDVHTQNGKITTELL